MGKDRLPLYGLNKDTLAYSEAEEQGPLKVKMKSLTHDRLTLCSPVDCSPPGSSVPWDSLGKNTGVDCHFLLQGSEPMSPALASGFFAY